MSSAAIPSASCCDCGYRIVRHTERAGEHVGAAAGQHAERRLGAGHTGRHLVERAVAAVADHDVDPSPGRVLGESGGVTTTIGLDDLDVVALG